MTTWVTLHMYTETHTETCPPLLSHAQVGVEPNKRDAASNITVTAMIQFQLEMGELVSKVANVIMEYMRDKGLQSPFAHGKPGSDWWVGFMRRWLKLCERKPQHFAAN